MTYGIVGKNRKFEDFLIFVETSPYNQSMNASTVIIKMPIIGYKIFIKF